MLTAKELPRAQISKSPVPSGTAVWIQQRAVRTWASEPRICNRPGRRCDHSSGPSAQQRTLAEMGQRSEAPYYRRFLLERRIQIPPTTARTAVWRSPSAERSKVQTKQETEANIAATDKALLGDNDVRLRTGKLANTLGTG